MGSHLSFAFSACCAFCVFLELFGGWDAFKRILDAARFFLAQRGLVATHGGPFGLFAQHGLMATQAGMMATHDVATHGDPRIFCGRLDFWNYQV